MGVYIPNMEKPKKCVGCPIDERWCKLWKDFDRWDVETHPDCPVIEIDHTNTELLEFFNEFKMWKASKEVAELINALYGERRIDEK